MGSSISNAMASDISFVTSWSGGTKRLKKRKLKTAPKSSMSMMLIDSTLNCPRKYSRVLKQSNSILKLLRLLFCNWLKI